MFEGVKLTAHHVGCLTQDIEASAEIYRNLGFTNKSETLYIASQNVKICFIEIRPAFFIELVEFSKDNRSLAKIFNSKNPYYHIGYYTANVAQAIAQLEEKGCFVVQQFMSEAYPGKPCAFLYTADGHLIELIEMAE